MSIQSIAHYLVPASIRDIGTGIHHLAKKDATEEQCQKLVAGAIRVTAAAALIFAEIAAIALFPPVIGLLASLSIVIIPRFLDTETSSLALGASLISTGLSSIASGISLLANKMFGESVLSLIYGTAITGFGWLATRMPRDLEASGANLLKDQIDDLANDWGSTLYHKFSPAYARE